MTASMLIEQGEVGLWYTTSLFLGFGILLFVFVPVWAGFKFENENDFIFIRYQGKWARILHRFRGYYVGLVVISALAAMSILAFADIATSLTGISKTQLILFAGLFVSINVFSNTLQNKLKSDYIHGIILAVILIAGLYQSGLEPVSLANFGAIQKSSFGAFPYFGHEYFLHFIAYVGLLWWSSTLFDGSGIIAQRVMGLEKAKAQRIFLAYIIIVGLAVVLLCYLILKAWETNAVDVPVDQVLYVWLSNGWPQFSKIIGLFLVFSLFVSISETQLNWAGSLIDSTAESKKSKGRRYIFMLIPALLSMVIALYFERIQGVIYFFLGISGGTSLIFILRWFTPRVNAQVQFSAMLGAILLTLLCNLLIDYNIISAFPEHRFILSLIFITVANLLLAFLVSIFTYNPISDKQAFNKFQSATTPSLTLIRKLPIALLFGLSFTAIVYWLFRWVVAAS